MHKFFKNLAKLVKTQKVNGYVVKENRVVKTLAAIILAVICFIMTILNIVDQDWIMTMSTFLLMVGFIICALFSGVFNLLYAYKILLSILVTGTFTFYAIKGSVNGFAILWILLVPLLYMTVLDINIGFICSVYFQLLLVVMFYTPLRYSFQSVYSLTFMNRIPVLYLADWTVSFAVLVQKEINQLNIAHSAYYDELTGVGNRRLYKNILDKYSRNREKTNIDSILIMVFDVNELKNVNDLYGHSTGDLLIMSSARLIKESFKCNSEEVFRTGGDEFIVIKNLTKDELVADIQEFEEKCKNCRIDKLDGVSISYGYAFWNDYPDKTISEIDIIADNAMYTCKDAYYKGKGSKRRS